MMPLYDTALLRHIADRHQLPSPQERKAARNLHHPGLGWLQMRLRALLNRRPPLHLLTNTPAGGSQR